MGTYILTKSHAPNCDIRGGYWTEPLDDGAAKKSHHSTLRECIHAFEAYIDRNGLGGGNLPCDSGKVTKDGVVIGYISYNGRVWARPPCDWRDNDAMKAQHEIDPDTGSAILEEA